MACWKCHGQHTDASGYCRRCGADFNYRPRPPTAFESAPNGRREASAPRAIYVDRNIAKIEQVELRRRLRLE